MSHDPLTTESDHFDASREIRWAIACSLTHCVASVFEVGVAELAARTRGRMNIAFARQVAMYLAHVTCGLNLTEVGRLFARDRTTVAHACRMIELRRDEIDFDRALDALESIASSRFERADIAALGLGMHEPSAACGPTREHSDPLNNKIHIGHFGRAMPLGR